MSCKCGEEGLLAEICAVGKAPLRGQGGHVPGAGAKVVLWRWTVRAMEAHVAQVC